MKSIKYSYGLKSVAFLLAFACVFSAALYTQMVVQTFYSYGWDLGISGDGRAFTDTTIFEKEVGSTISDLEWAYLKNGWEEDVLPQLPSLEEEQEDILRQFEQFKQEMYNVYGGSVEPATDVYGTTQEPVVAYGNVSEDGTSTSGYANYFELSGVNANPIFLYSNDTEQDVCEAVAKEYENALDQSKRTYESNVYQAQQNLGKLKNAEYYLYNPLTGEAFTNIQGSITPEAFEERGKQSDWYIGYTADSGLSSYSDSVNIDTFYQGQYYPLADEISDKFSKKGYDLYLRISMPLQQGDSYADAEAEFLSGASQIRTRCLATIVLLVAAAALSLYLVLAAGHVRGREGICLAPGDKMPNDLHFVLSWGLSIAVCCSALYCGYIFAVEERVFFQTLGALLSAVLYALLIEWINSVAKGYKAGRPYFRSTLFVKLFIAWHKGNKKLFGALRRIYLAKLTSLSKKVRWFAFFYLAVNAVLSLFTFERIGVALFLLVSFNVICLILVWRYVISLDKIITAAQKAHDGEPAQLLDTQSMPQPLRSLAENFTAAQESKAAAIEEALKGERMKTELITNVSHDLKTPLTSIISYVDLLEKCDIQDETAQKYIRVLDEKSGRLKRLIEDLVEASKVSSGAVTLNKIRVNLCELATQAVGEMEDSFASC